MEKSFSIGFFLLNFAMSEGHKTFRKALFDRLIQRPDKSPNGRGNPIVTQSVAKSLENVYVDEHEILHFTPFRSG